MVHESRLQFNSGSTKRRAHDPSSPWSRERTPSLSDTGDSFTPDTQDTPHSPQVGAVVGGEDTEGDTGDRSPASIEATNPRSPVSIESMVNPTPD